MDSVDFWLKIKPYIAGIVTYAFPALSLLIAILSFKDSKKAGKVKDRLNEIEEKLKKYELEEKEKEREEASKAYIEARIYNVSKGKYRLKIWNSGKATAYNVDFVIPEENKAIIWRQKVPFEMLESNKNFEEVVVVHSGTPSKFKLTTTWEDEHGSHFEKEQFVSV